MKNVKHFFEGHEFRGQWSEDQCRLSLKYEGPDGTVEGTTTIGPEGNLCVRAGSFNDSSVKIPFAERGKAAKKIAGGLSGWIIFEYRQKYGMLGKKDVCSSMSEWAEKNPD